ncbi:NrdH-redoxin [Candidatus Saccharibacteria bacterium]|nr:NrdH-redoxin [Candidatus Saccharibacteria bacterium]
MSEDNSSMPQDDAKKVIVYSTNWCAYCKMAKQYLVGKNVPVEEKNIEEDADAHKELMDKIGGNFRGVPVIDINGTIVLGFDRPKIDAALKAAE